MEEASPSGAELVALARARLADELRELDALGGAARWARLLQAQPTYGVSRGALVHCIRLAVYEGDQPTAEALFVALIGRIDGLTRQWVRRTVLSFGRSLSADEWREYAADLAQELTLRLWLALTRDRAPAWELFFGRALAYLQGRIATSWRRSMRSPTVSLSDLLERGEESVDIAHIAPGRLDELSQVELADLRALVAQLPERERLVIVLRFWVGASEDVIADALGGVTTRTVRALLTRAYARLRAYYGVLSDTTFSANESD